MLSYCLKYRENTESKNPNVVRSKNGRVMLLSKCEVCVSKKLKFIKVQEANGSLTSLGKKTPLRKISLLGFFCNKFLLARDTFMTEMHLRKPGFTYSACGLFIKSNKKMQKVKETGYSQYIYQMNYINLVFNTRYLMEF